MSLAATPIAMMAEFLAGYAIILLTPGPNLFAVAGLAAVRGLRAARPLCLGLGLGAGALCGVAAAAAHAESGTGPLPRVIGAGLLVWVAIRIARRRATATAPAPSRTEAMTTFAAGFATASTNPLTAAYFLSASLRAEAAPGYPVVVRRSWVSRPMCIS